MFSGRVKRFIAGKGFGFLIPDDGSPDLFVHISNVAGGIELTPGARVKFRIASNLRTTRPEAVDVVVIE